MVAITGSIPHYHRTAAGLWGNLQVVPNLPPTGLERSPELREEASENNKSSKEKGEESWTNHDPEKEVRPKEPSQGSEAWGGF